MFLKLRVVLLFAIACFALQGHGQCKMHAKKNCVPHLKPFLFNGQINTVKLSEGEMAELDMTLLQDQVYRIYICSFGEIEELEWRVVDAASQSILFDSKEHNSVAFWDFNVKSVQQVAIRVLIPPTKKKSAIPQSGCVSILVGLDVKK